MAILGRWEYYYRSMGSRGWERYSLLYQSPALAITSWSQFYEITQVEIPVDAPRNTKMAISTDNGREKLLLCFVNNAQMRNRRLGCRKDSI